MNINYLVIIFIFFLTMSCCFASSDEIHDDYDLNINCTDLGENDFNRNLTINNTTDCFNTSDNYMENNRTNNIYLNESVNSSENGSGLEYGVNDIITTITAIPFKYIIDNELNE